MIVVNLENVEELILKNNDLVNSLPDLRYLVDQWLLTYRIPFMRNLKKKTLINFLNAIEEKHLKILQEYLGDSLAIYKINSDIVKNISFPVNIDIADYLDNEYNFSYYCISRDENKVYLTFWR